MPKIGIENPRVGGSIPSSATKISKARRNASLFCCSFAPVLHRLRLCWCFAFAVCRSGVSREAGVAEIAVRACDLMGRLLRGLRRCYRSGSARSLVFFAERGSALHFACPDLVGALVLSCLAATGAVRIPAVRDASRPARLAIRRFPAMLPGACVRPAGHLAVPARRCACSPHPAGV